MQRTWTSLAADAERSPRLRRREQIVGADKIACITSHFVPVIQEILQLNSALCYLTATKNL